MLILHFIDYYDYYNGVLEMWLNIIQLRLLLEQGMLRHNMGRM